MPSVLGIDYSSRAVDLVFLDESTDTARWHSIPLERGVAGARSVRQKYAWGSALDDVYLVAVEDPMSAGLTVAKQLGRVCGAILSSLPWTLSDDLVWMLQPSEWKLACGLSGNASKQDVARWALERFDCGMWSQDALDAVCMAHAARDINARALAA